MVREEKQLAVNLNFRYLPSCLAKGKKSKINFSDLSMLLLTKRYMTGVVHMKSLPSIMTFLMATCKRKEGAVGIG